MSVAAEQARELHDSGLGYKRIAKRLGVSATTVRRLLDSDYAERMRVQSREAKRRRTGVCKTCGGVTRYGGGKVPVSEECAECVRRRQHEERYWTRERIVECIQRFAREHGRPPVSSEWLYGDHGANGDGYPYCSTVLQEFGSWADAIEQAGFPRPRIGVYERTSEWRARMSEARRLPDEVYLDRIRQASVTVTLAPSTMDKRVSSAHQILLRRGISWDDACRMVGAVSRSEALKDGRQ